MKEKKIKGFNVYEDGYWLNRIVKLSDTAAISAYTQARSSIALRSCPSLKLSPQDRSKSLFDINLQRLLDNDKSCIILEYSIIYNTNIYISNLQIVS